MYIYLYTYAHMCSTVKAIFTLNPTINIQIIVIRRFSELTLKLTFENILLRFIHVVGLQHEISNCKIIQHMPYMIASHLVLYKPAQFIKNLIFWLGCLLNIKQNARCGVKISLCLYRKYNNKCNICNPFSIILHLVYSEFWEFTTHKL